MNKMHRFQKQYHAENDDEISLKELGALLWQGRKFILLFALLFGFVSAFIAINRVSLYQSQVLLFDRQTNGDDKNLSGLAALAGISLGAGENQNANIALEMLNSRRFIASFIKKYGFEVPIVAAIGWDKESNNLRIDDEIYDVKNKTWVKDNKNFSHNSPTDSQLFELFTKQIFWHEEGKNNQFHTLYAKHYSPFIAKEILEKLVEEINLLMQERAINEASTNLTYLQNQLNKTSIAEMQLSLYDLISEQTKAMMLAQARDNFVFEILDPPEVADKSMPSKALLIIALAMLLGAMMGMLLSFYFSKK